MQQAKQASFRQYVLAGNALAQRERIAVSSHVTVENPGDQDLRERFVADQGKSRGPTVSYRFALVVVACCLFALTAMMLGKANLTRQLQGEYARLGDRYQAAAAEERRLTEVFAQKSDESGICYYAVQSLGMRRAGDAETIGVQAAGLPALARPDTLKGSASTGH